MQFLFQTLLNITSLKCRPLLLTNSWSRSRKLSMALGVIAGGMATTSFRIASFNCSIVPGRRAVKIRNTRNQTTQKKLPTAILAAPKHQISRHTPKRTSAKILRGFSVFSFVLFQFFSDVYNQKQTFQPVQKSLIRYTTRSRWTIQTCDSPK